jgi:SpoVK/Ycf46/Vps4 family AAA+-type ATPase
MPAGDLAEIVKTAGFSVPADAGLLAKRKPASQAKTEAKTAIPKEAVKPEQPQSPEELDEAKVFRLPGRPQLEEFFNEHVIDIIFNAEKYQVLGIDFPSAIVLHGPPGCGKTFAVERLVEFIDWPSYSIDSNSVGSPYIHETSKKISEVFDKAIDGAPSVVVIDEMESFLSDRRSGSSSGLHHVEEVAEFLRRIPEAIKNKVLIIAMTNLIEMIDPAILRRGRFDHIIEVGMPSRVEVASLVDSLLSKLPKAGDLNVDKILDALTGKALSDSAFVIREAARLAAKAGKTELDQTSIEAALNSLPKDQKKKSRRIGFACDDK